MKYLSQELSKFHEQLRYAIENYRSPSIDRAKIQQIVICGLGGSGIAGQLIRNYFLDKMPYPVEVIADYTLPRYVGEHALAILCSYSGNTEETLQTYSIAREKGAQMIVISKGGTISAWAEEHGYTLYKAESGFQPRVALGYPLGYLLSLFFDLLGQAKKADLLHLADRLSNSRDYEERSEALVKPFKNSLNQKFVIVTDVNFEAVAIRLANQIQENAKIEAFVVTLPEANHNVIESYYQAWPSNYIFLNSGVSKRTNLRFHFVKELLKKYGMPTAEIQVMDTDLIGLTEAVYLCDWISLQLADQLGAVSNTVPNINELKKFLSEHEV